MGAPEGAEGAEGVEGGRRVRGTKSRQSETPLADTLPGSGPGTKVAATSGSGDSSWGALRVTGDLRAHKQRKKVPDRRSRCKGVWEGQVHLRRFSISAFGGDGQPQTDSRSRQPRPRAPCALRTAAGPAQCHGSRRGGALTFSSRSSGAGPSKSWILSSMHFLRRSVLLLLLARGFLALACGWRGERKHTGTCMQPASQSQAPRAEQARGLEGTTVRSRCSANCDSVNDRG